ncbi:hypothetical protein [Dinoroseobacter sp. S375]|uniref:hypothetical protein n=1 Tax=Dinoroseobacter sp. S375 TaxID=3415136 RepID=UPI003C7C0E38
MKFLQINILKVHQIPIHTGRHISVAANDDLPFSGQDTRSLRSMTHGWMETAALRDPDPSVPRKLPADHPRGVGQSEKEHSALRSQGGRKGLCLSCRQAMDRRASTG